MKSGEIGEHVTYFMESCSFGPGFPSLKKGAAWGRSRLFSSCRIRRFNTEFIHDSEGLLKVMSQQ
jgi:hypothetical protein